MKPYSLWIACLFLLFAIGFCQIADAQQIGIDQATLKQKLTDVAMEKIFDGLSNASEEQLKDATYFNELVRDLEPFGVKLTETNFNETARAIYSKYKEAYDKEKDPRKAREKLKEMLKGDIQGQIEAVILQSMDKESQEAISDLQGLYADAKKDLQSLTDFNDALAADPDADWTKLAKEYGIKGEFLEKLGKLEGDFNSAADKYGDYYKASKIIYQGMSGHSGDKIEALFELGAEFGGKIPVLGKFVELYFKVGQEMLKAVGRTGELLQERQQGCLGVGTVGWIQTITAYTNERNRTFSSDYDGTTACPINAALDFYKDIYQDINNPGQLYFWTGSGFVKGNPEHGGIESVKGLRRWLRKNNHAGKSDDVAFMAEAYNMTPGFTEFQKNAGKIIDNFNKQISRVFSGFCLRRSAAYQSFVADRADLNRIIETSDGRFSSPYKGDWSYFKLYEEIAMDLFVEERYLKKSAPFGNACKDAAIELENLETVQIEGTVFFKDSEGQVNYHSGAAIEIAPMDYLVEECSQLTADRGYFRAVFFLEKGGSLSVDLRADDGVNYPGEASVNVTGNKRAYKADLTIESKCGKGERLDADGNCVPVCKAGEKLDADGNCVPVDVKCKDGEKLDADGNCVPVCPDGGKPDADGNCVPVCKPNEKLDADGNCVPVCKDGEKLNEKGECVPDGPGGDALEKVKAWLAKAQKQAGIVSESLKTVESVKAEIAEMLAAKKAALGQSLIPPADAAELMAACSDAQTKSQALQNDIQSARAVSDGHLNTLKQSYAEVSSARKNACQQADQASASQDPEECKRAASRAAVHAAAARQSARNAQAAADKMKSVYARIQSQNEMASLNQVLGKIPAAIESLNDQIARAENLLADLKPTNFDEKRQQGLAAAVRADEAAQQVPDIVAIIHGLLTDIDPALLQQAQEIKEQADAVKATVASHNQSAAQAAEAISAAGERAGSVAAETTAKIEELTAIRESLASCRNIDLGANLNEVRTNSDIGEIFGPAAKGEAENATICAGGAEAICDDLASAGCSSTAECAAGYVCENRKCVSPFDSGYDDYTDTMGQRDSDRSQDRADQVAADQSSRGGRSGFTSGDMDQDIASAQDAVAGKCSDSQCPPGYVCRGGQCVEKSSECNNDSDCQPGNECRHGECVPKSDCSSDADCTGDKVCKDGKCVDPAPSRAAELTVSPANKAIVLNETVNLKAVYTDTDGSTKDVTAEAAWSPSASFSSGEIGVYPVTATYNGMVGSSQITVVQEKGMDDITVNQKVITVTFWDSGRLEDGDMIDILINGEVVFPGITLTFAKQSRTITMNADIIVVGFKALNEGSAPPNTASVTFSAVTAGKETQKYSLKKHQSANMNVNYKP